MQQNVAFPAKIVKHFGGRGVTTLDTFGILMSLPKMNPLSKSCIRHWEVAIFGSKQKTCVLELCLAYDTYYNNWCRCWFKSTNTRLLCCFSVL